jgi:hypothetical protein
MPCIWRDQSAHAEECARGYRAGMATHWTLGCDAADPHGIAAFWATALGYVVEPGYDDPPLGPQLSARSPTVSTLAMW